MKRELWLVAIFLASVLVFTSSALAGGVGASIPVSPKEGMGVGIGVDTNFVLERDLAGSGAITGAEIQESNQISALLTLQPFKFFTASFRMGTANLEAKYNWSNNRSQTIKFDYGLLIGGDANLMYEFENKFGIGWDNQLSWWHNEADTVTGDNSPSFSAKGSVDNYDFQSTIYGKYSFELGTNKLTPYAGVFYSNFKSKIDSSIQVQDSSATYTYGDLENKDNIGAVVGLNYNLGKNLLLNVEGRFNAETAMTAAAAYKF